MSEKHSLKKMKIARFKEISLNAWSVSTRDLKTTYFCKVWNLWSKSNICFTTISDPEQPCMCCFGWIQWQLFKCFYWLYFCFLRDIILKEDGNNNKCKQSIIFKLVSYCFEETIGFEVKASFVSRPISRLIRWYNNQVV